MFGSRIQSWLLLATAHAIYAAPTAQLSVEPSRVYLFGTGSSQQLQVTAYTADGLLTDVTQQATYRATKDSILQIAPNGAITALKTGFSEVFVTFGGRTASTRVLVVHQGGRPQVDFDRDVIPILTMMGCNGANCHGSMHGKADFKLSQFGYESTDDYKAIVHGEKARRVNLQQPEKSLILAKPSFSVPHGGGKRFDVGSPEYVTLLDWLRSGAPGPNAGFSPRIQRLEVFPAERVLSGPGATQQLVVRAHYTDRTIEDLTHKVKYVSLDDAVLRVDTKGVVHAIKPGEAAILIRAPGATAATRLGVRVPGKHTGAFPTEANFIDRQVFGKLKRMNVTPAGVASDDAFIRRAYLDTLGILPSAQDFEQFRKDGNRSRLVDRILNHPDYGEYWGQQWADLLTVNSFKSGASLPSQLDRWLRDQFRQNVPYDRLARTLIGGSGPVAPEPGLGLIVARTPPEAASFYSQVFLGVRIQCAQCHDHPFEKWRRSDFYGVAAFFSQVGQKTTKLGPVVYDDPSKEFTNPLTKTAAHPVFLGGTAASRTGTLRRQFADWLTKPENPYFAKAIVNRIWKHFFAVGLVEPVDDFRETNPPSNAALLDELASEFVRGGYDLKSLMRPILLSSTYQLSSQTAPGTEFDKTLYSRYYYRRLPAEPLLDAISQVTESRHRFRFGYEGMRAIQLHDPAMYDSFLQAFDRSRREMVCERVETHTLLQTMEMVSGDAVNAKIRNSPFVKQLVGMSDLDAINSIYQRSLGRRPTPEEIDSITTLMSKGESRRAAIEDLLWAALNSREFLFNH